MSRHTTGWRSDYKKAKWTGAGRASWLSTRVPRQIFSLTGFRPSAGQRLWILAQIYSFSTTAGIADLIQNKNCHTSHYLDLQIPRIINLKPSRGPASGGTIVNITGSHLDAGSNVSVMFKDQPCTYMRSVGNTHHTQINSDTSRSLEFKLLPFVRIFFLGIYCLVCDSLIVLFTQFLFIKANSVYLMYWTERINREAYSCSRHNTLLGAL